MGARYFAIRAGFRAVMSTKVRVGIATALAAATAALGLADGDAVQEADAAKAKQPRPNVVVVMSDDQTQDSMRYMERTRELIGSQGATFPTSVTNWPLCCPSRATFQNGQYAHNHGVLGNQPPLGGFDRLDLNRTLPVWLQESGYYTAHIGKFLNGYERSPVGVPPGWSEWHGSKDTYRFYGYTLLENGSLNTYGSPDENPDAPADPASYSTDVYTDKAVDLIARRAPARKPFFLSVAYLAPHSGAPNPPEGADPYRCQGSAKPAIRHAGAFAGEALPQPPNFN
jgi:N-acetylglucosamine-6-sulfatase